MKKARRKTNLSTSEDERRDREEKGKRGRLKEGRGTKWESSRERKGRRGR